MDTLDKILEKVDVAELKKELHKWGQNFLQKIEDEQTFSFLRVMRCGYAQGYLISKPMEVSDTPEFLKGYLFLPKEPA